MNAIDRFKVGLKSLKTLMKSMMKKFGFADYVTEDGKVLISFPNDIPRVGDIVVVEKEGQVIDNFSGTEVVQGVGGKFEVVIADGIVNEVKQIDAQSQEQEGQQSQQSEQSQQSQQSQDIDEQIFSTMMSAIIQKQNKQLIERFNSLEKENAELKKQIETIWRALQDNKSKTSLKSNETIKFHKF